jgi:hypothetical protein
MKSLAITLFVIFCLVGAAHAQSGLVAEVPFESTGGGGTGGGGGTTITSGAGDFGAATAQSGAVLTGVVVNQHLTLTTIINTASPYTVLSTDVFIICDDASGAITVNLPAATGSMRSIWLQTTSSLYTCSPTAAGSDKINGAASAALAGTNSLYQLIDSRSGKWILATTSTTSLTLNGGGGALTISTNGSGQLVVPGPIVTSTSIISSTTGAIGPTGGGVLQSYGGTVPTCACTGGSPTCTVATAGSNSAGQIGMTGGTAATTCTLTFSASGVFHAAPICGFFDANASVTPLGYSVGAVSTSTAVVDFAAATAATINYICIGH